MKLTFNFGACDANGLAPAEDGGSIPAAAAAADGGGRTVAALLLPAPVAAGDLLRLLFRGMFMLTLRKKKVFEKLFSYYALIFILNIDKP